MRAIISKFKQIIPSSFLDPAIKNKFLYRVNIGGNLVCTDQISKDENNFTVYIDSKGETYNFVMGELLFKRESDIDLDEVNYLRSNKDNIVTLCGIPPKGYGYVYTHTGRRTNEVQKLSHSRTKRHNINYSARTVIESLEIDSWTDFYLVHCNLRDEPYLALWEEYSSRWIIVYLHKNVEALKELVSIIKTYHDSPIVFRGNLL